MSTLVSNAPSIKEKEVFSVPYILTAFFVLSWVVIFYEVSPAVGALILMGLIVFQFSSYSNSISVLLMTLWVPFFDNLIGEFSQALDAHRILFIPFYFLSLRQAKLRSLPGKRKYVWLILISLVLLQATAAVQVLHRGMPLGTDQEGSSLYPVLAYIYDNIIVLTLIYFCYTRLSLERLNYFMDLIIFLTALQALAIVHLTVLNLDMLTRFRSDSILWSNPYFGHKNDWSMVFVFVALLALTRKTYKDGKGLFYLICLGAVLLGISLSLSRQAYVWTFGVFVLLAFFNGKFKIIGYLLGIIVLLLIIQPDFLYERMEGMLNASNQEEFQSLNRKVSDLALEQAVNNFTVVPRMFVQNWEYNWSEGFWNGFLHQQGILGLLFVFVLYIMLYLRFWNISKQNSQRLRYLARMGMIMLILMFFANFTRRHTHLMHYKGEIGQIGLLFMFLWMYVEVGLKYFFRDDNKLNAM